jgi:hypothetical protein
MRFTLSVNSGGDYDSDDYFTAERTFNSEYLGDTVEHIETFLRSAGFDFGHLEVINKDELNPDMLTAQDRFNLENS